MRHGGEGRFIGAGADRARLAGRRKQGCCLGVDDLLIKLQAQTEIADMVQLQHFALGDDARGARQYVENAQIAGLDHQIKGAGEQKIADQHAAGIAPDHLRRALAAPHAAAIDDVVMQQGGRMDELDRRRQFRRARAAAAKHMR